MRDCWRAGVELQSTSVCMRYPHSHMRSQPGSSLSKSKSCLLLLLTSLQCCSIIVYAKLMYNFGRRSRSNEVEQVQLVQSIRSGYLQEWLNRLDRQINLVRGSSSLRGRAAEERVEEAAQVIDSVRQSISSLLQ